MLNVSIVLYNTPLDMIRRTIGCVLGCPAVTTLYLIDNSPSDALKILSDDERIVYIHNPSNPGYGSAHNIALRHSLEAAVPYHLVLNPDVYFESSILDGIAAFMQNQPDVGLLMPKVLYPDGRIQYLAKLLPTPWDLFARRFIRIRTYLDALNQRYALMFYDYSRTVDIPFISGCFMFLRVETLHQSGIFDENFFMYMEDVDLSRRIGTVARTVLYPKVTVFHEYERGAHKNLSLLWRFIQSVFIYFNKYGWFIDPERRRINLLTLRRLGWRKG